MGRGFVPPGAKSKSAPQTGTWRRRLLAPHHKRLSRIDALVKSEIGRRDDPPSPGFSADFNLKWPQAETSAG